MKEYIDASAFKEMILCADAALQKDVQKINELNVFPVPDGDTGTNMGMTIGNAAKDLRAKDAQTVGEAAKTTASAMLRGARGNSGVILSLLFRGISKRMKGMETADAAGFAAALTDGVEAAYKAVMKPAEGTILTVSRLAAEAATTAAKKQHSLEEVFISAIAAGDDALANTVNLNPVLKKAGVVDAGGQGFMVILKAMLASLRGEVISTDDIPEEPAAEKTGNVFSEFETSDIRFTYCTEFIVERENDKSASLLRAFLDPIGDSIVVVSDEDVIKVHVHTNDPGRVLTEAVTYGHFVSVKIENMKLQHTAMTEAAPEAKEAEPEIAAPEKQYGIVTVCAGEGMEALFRELGADGIVTGGQTMNPSTEDILKEINKTPSEVVFVFPNNKNIIMAAEQCVPLTEKKVVVLPSKTVPQGITALLNFNPDLDEEELKNVMTESMDTVHTAMVTYAARNSDYDGHNIHAGEFLALLDGALLGSYTNITTLFKELSWAIDEFGPEYITVYYGCDVNEADAEEAAKIIEGNFPEADVKTISGGQPVYYYMISVE